MVKIKGWNDNVLLFLIFKRGAKVTVLDKGGITELSEFGNGLLYRNYLALLSIMLLVREKWQWVMLRRWDRNKVFYARSWRTCKGAFLHLCIDKLHGRKRNEIVIWLSAAHSTTETVKLLQIMAHFSSARRGFRVTECAWTLLALEMVKVQKCKLRNWRSSIPPYSSSLHYD